VALPLIHLSFISLCFGLLSAPPEYPIPRWCLEGHFYDEFSRVLVAFSVFIYFDCQNFLGSRSIGFFHERDGILRAWEFSEGIPPVTLLKPSKRFRFFRFNIL